MFGKLVGRADSKMFGNVDGKVYTRWLPKCLPYIWLYTGWPVIQGG